MSRRRTAIRAALAVIGAVSVIVGLAAPAGASPAGTPGLDTASIVPNTTGTLTGHDFPASMVLALDVSDPAMTVPATVTADASGQLSVPYSTTSALRAGAFDLEFHAGRFSFSAPLLSAAPAVDLGSTTPAITQSGTIALTVRGYAADENLRISCTCTATTAAPVRADGTGAASADVVVRGPRLAAVTDLVVIGTLSERTASTPFYLATTTATGPQLIESLLSPNRMFDMNTVNGVIQIDQTIGGFGSVWNATGQFTGHSGTLSLQSDGNLVVRDPSGRATWQSRTVGAGPNVSLTMQDDGNLVLRSQQGRALWSTGTWLIALTAGQAARPGQTLHANAYYASMQTDGNLVLRYSVYGDSRVLWATNTHTPGSTLTVQSDGNAVIRDARGVAVWSTGTANRCPAPRLAVQYDQNFVLRSTTTGRACWSTGTGIPMG